MRVSKTADMSAGPAGTMRRRFSGAVQDGSDCIVRQLPREYANQIDDAGLGSSHRVWPTLFFLTFISV